MHYYLLKIYQKYLSTSNPINPSPLDSIRGIGGGVRGVGEGGINMRELYGGEMG